MILVVDDDHDYLALLTEILTSEGYNVRPSDSGELALASIASKQPELILLDIRMPGMGGFEVCRRIKARKETRDIPIIFLSGAYEAQERVEGLKLKAVDFISKPFHRDELTARVRTHLELSRLRSDLELQVAQRTAALRAANELLKVELAERRRTEQALRESEERFRHLANRAPVGIWVMGPNQELLFRNTRTFTFAGRQLPQGGREWTAAIHPEDLPNVQARYAAALEAGRGFRIECRVCRANGKYRWVLNTGLPRFVDGELAGYIGTSVDITDLKRSHERMLATEKLESLGALTAGIAHDFNNLVGSIFAASDLALSDLPPGSAAREDIDRINVVATRASQLVNLLMAYTGGHNARRDRIDLSLVVAEMLSILKSTVAPNATIRGRSGLGSSGGTGQYHRDPAGRPEPGDECFGIAAAARGHHPCHYRTCDRRTQHNQRGRKLHSGRILPSCRLGYGVRHATRSTSPCVRSFLYHQMHRPGAGALGGARDRSLPGRQH